MVIRLTSGAKNTANTNFFGDAETQDVDFIIAGPLSGASAGNEVTTLAEATTQANNLIAFVKQEKIAWQSFHQENRIV